VELANYIKNLLYNNDKVIIAGFGTLKTVYKPAEVSSSQHTITPPFKTLEFDESLTDSDGQLEQFIASNLNISKKKAENKISEQIKAEIKKLDAGETLFWEGIGYFAKEEEKIRFNHEQHSNFLTDSFGLSTVEFKPVEFKISPTNADVAPAQPVKKSRILVYLILFIFIIIVGGGVALFFVYPDLAARFKHHVAKPVVIKPTDTTTHKAVTIKKDTTANAEVENEVDKNIEKKQALSLNSAQQLSNVESATFYIIAGSFKTSERASILADQLKKEGYKPEVIQFEPGLYRVSLGKFSDKNQALQETDRIKAAKGANAVWLFSKK
jgi:Cell division protein